MPNTLSELPPVLDHKDQNEEVQRKLSHPERCEEQVYGDILEDLIGIAHEEFNRLPPLVLERLTIEEFVLINIHSKECIREPV